MKNDHSESSSLGFFFHLQRFFFMRVLFHIVILSILRHILLSTKTVILFLVKSRMKVCKHTMQKSHKVVKLLSRIVEAIFPLAQQSPAHRIYAGAFLRWRHLPGILQIDCLPHLVSWLQFYDHCKIESTGRFARFIQLEKVRRLYGSTFRQLQTSSL